MKKALKVLLWFAGIALVLVILAVVAAYLFFPLEKAKAYAIERGSVALNRPLQVKGVNVSFWGGLGVVLEDVSIGNPEAIGEGELLVAEHVDVKLRLLPLISGEYEVDRLVIKNPHIRLRVLADGSNNFTFDAIEQKAPPEMADQIEPETKAAAVAVSFDKLEISDGNLEFSDDSTGVNFTAVGLDLQTTLETPRPGVYKSAGRISIDGLGIPEANDFPELSIDLKYSGGFDLGQDLITLDNAQLTANGVTVDLVGSVMGVLESPRGKVSVKSDQIPVESLLAFLSPVQRQSFEGFAASGNLAVDMDVEYDPRDKEALSYFGTAILSALTLSSDTIPGQLSIKKALVDFKSDNLRMTIQDGAFDGESFKGHLVVNDFDNPDLNGELAGGLNLEYLAPFLPAQQDRHMSGRCQFDIKISGGLSDWKSMDFSGNLKVRDGSYRSAALPIPFDSLDLDVYFDRSLSHVKKFSSRTPSGRLEFTGRVYDLVPYLLADSEAVVEIKPRLEGKLVGDLDVSILNQFLPAKGGPKMEGRLDFNLDLEGVLSDVGTFAPTGSIFISDASYTDSLLPEPIEQFSAEIVAREDTLEVRDMSVRFSSSDVSLVGKLSHPFPYFLPINDSLRNSLKKPVLVFELSSGRFDTDRLFPEAVPGTGLPEQSAVTFDSVSSIMLPNIEGAGVLTVDTLIYSAVEFTEIAGRMRIHDRIIECYDVTGKVYSGGVAGGSTVDLTDFTTPRYSGQFEASNIEADDFISHFSTLGGHFFGKMNLDGTFAATGWDPDSIPYSLNMNSTFTMANGKVVTTGAVHQAINTVAKLFGKEVAAEQALKNLTTFIKVEDGKVMVDRLRTSLGNLGDLSLNGFYAFDGTVQYQGTILLSQEWSQKNLSGGGLLGGLAGLLTDKNDSRVRLPISLLGTLDDPRLEVDYGALKKGLGDNLSDQAGNLLNDLIRKNKK